MPKTKKHMSKKKQPEPVKDDTKDQFTTEDLIRYLMNEKQYQAREARMIVRDFLDAVDIPLSENKDIIFRGHFVLKKKKLSTRMVGTGIMRRNNPTMPLADKIIVARRTTHKFVPSTKLKERMKQNRTLPDSEFKTMMTDRK